MTSARSLLHVCAPARFGGLERAVSALAAGLAERGHRVSLAAVLDLGVVVPPALAQAAERGVDLVPLHLPARAYPAERRAIDRLARAIGAGVLHTHGYRSDVVAGPLAPGLGAARVSTAHGFVGGGLRNRAYEWLQVRALRRCDAVVAVSGELARTLRAAGVERVRTIPNGTPLEGATTEAGEARRELGVPGDAFHVGWVGRLSPEKGPDLFLEALARLGAEIPLAASVIGEGGMRAELERLAVRLGLEGRVRFVGRVDDAARLFPAFDAFVLSSRREGTPISLLEAIAAGTPVVASRVGGVPVAAGAHGALLVEPGDVTALAAALRDVWSDPVAASKRALAASAHRARGPDWIRAYEEVYASVTPAAGRALEGTR